MTRVKLIMPKLGMTMTNGTICEIKCQKGDFIKAGETIMEFETEKLTEPIVAPFDGYVVELLAQVDDEIDCGKSVCVFADQL